MSSPSKSEQGACSRVFVCVGSNIEPDKNIPEALKLLRDQVEVLAVSTFYRTPPIGDEPQPEYLNGMWLAETDIEPRPLKFDVLRAIEDRLGRKRSEDKYAPRTIDLDITLYGQLTIEEEDLRIPDPNLFERVFMIKTLLELDRDVIVPGSPRKFLEIEFDPLETSRMKADHRLTTLLRESLRE